MSGTVAITGASGFIGGHLVRRFQTLGWNVVALVRHPERPLAGVEMRKFILGEPLPKDSLTGVDLLIHTAYDFSLCGWADIARVNVVGSDYLFDAATRAGVKRSILISSMSAFEGCRSHYGRGKLAAENAVCIRGGIAVRPGMIYSETNGGLAAKIAAVARRMPVIPMIGRGDYPLFTCHADDLCDLIVQLAKAETVPDAILTAANPEPISLLKIVYKASSGKSRVVIALPWPLIAFGLWMLECLGMRPGFRSDSVVSLVHANEDPNFEPAKAFPVTFRPFG